MRSAFEDDPAGLCGQHEGGQNGLQDQRRTAGRADGKAVFAGAAALGAKDEFGRADRGSVRDGIPDFDRGLDRSEVLAQQSRLFAPGANVVDAKGASGDQREG